METHKIPRITYQEIQQVSAKLRETFALHGVTPSSISSFCSDLILSPQQREIVETQATSKLATTVANKVALRLGLADYNFEDWALEMRVNKYTFTQERSVSIAVLVHTDDGFLTILQDDEIFEGLKVKSPSSVYIDVDPMPNSSFVNIGDTTMAWSNGKLHSVRQFVEFKGVRTRVSTTMFLSPPRDLIIKPQAQFVAADKPALYAPFRYIELRKQRAERKMSVGGISLFLVGTKESDGVDGCGASE